MMISSSPLPQDWFNNLWILVNKEINSISKIVSLLRIDSISSSKFSKNDFKNSNPLRKIPTHSEKFQVTQKIRNHSKKFKPLEKIQIAQKIETGTNSGVNEGTIPLLSFFLLVLHLFSTCFPFQFLFDTFDTLTIGTKGRDYFALYNNHTIFCPSFINYYHSFGLINKLLSFFWIHSSCQTFQVKLYEPKSRVSLWYNWYIHSFTYLFFHLFFHFFILLCPRSPCSHVKRSRFR